eukprot:11278656-Heterocapsa_arctica.AAC.1
MQGHRTHESERMAGRAGGTLLCLPNATAPSLEPQCNIMTPLIHAFVDHQTRAMTSANMQDHRETDHACIKHKRRHANSYQQAYHDTQ